MNKPSSGFANSPLEFQGNYGSLNESTNSLEMDLRRIELEVEAGGGLRESEIRAFDSNMLEELDIANHDEGGSLISTFMQIAK